MYYVKQSKKGMIVLRIFSERGIRLILIAATWLMLALLPLESLHAEFGTPDSQSVLVLHSYSPTFRWTQDLHHGIMPVVQKRDIEVRVEFMDSKHHFSPAYFNRLKQLYQQKYGSKTIKGIIATDNNALLFAVRNAQELFSGAKVVAAGINYPQVIKDDLSQATIIVEQISFRQTIEDALKQNPGTRLVTLISDPTTTGQVILQEAKDALKETGETVDFRFLSHEPFEVIRQQVADAVKGELFYLISFFKDSTGRDFTYNEAARELASVADVPIYVAHDFQLETGVVGGNVISATKHGEQAAKLMINYLEGEQVPARFDKTTVTRENVYDYSVLKENGIAASSLPVDAVIYNEPLSYVRIHRGAILNTLGLATAFFLFCVLLVMNQAKKKKISTTSQALAETEARYRQLFDQSPIALREENLSELKGYLDKLIDEGVSDFREYFDSHPAELEICMDMIRVVDVNQATLKLYEAGSVTEISASRMVNPEKATQILGDQIAGLLQEGGFSQMVPDRTSKGRQIFVTQRAAVAKGYEENWAKVFVSTVDITAQEKLKEEKLKFEKQMQQSQKLEAIGSLAGGIAHDFNNILSPMMGRAELIMVESGSNSIQKEHSQGIIEAANRARELVKQILTFSRQVDQEIKPIDMVSVLKEVIRLVRPSIPPSIDLTTALPQSCAKVMADSTQIHQVIMNLITNSLHAMEVEGGRLMIKVDDITFGLDDLQGVSLTPGRYLCLTIEDSGHGMSKGVMAKIFDPYFTTKPEDKGSGLGLSVVHGIIRGYGGEVRVYSEEGEGTVFKVYLPVVEIAETGIEHPPTREELPSGSEYILLVDDEKAIADVTQTMLQRLGYRVSVRSSGFDALEAFRNLSDSIDLVITDLTMQQMTGLQLYREIKNIRPNIKVIVCTGFSEQLDNSKSKAIGIDGFLNKPVVMAELAAMVRSVLDN